RSRSSRGADDLNQRTISTLAGPTSTTRRFASVGSNADRFSIVRIGCSSFVTAAALTTDGSPGSFAIWFRSAARFAARISAIIRAVYLATVVPFGPHADNRDVTDVPPGHRRLPHSYAAVLLLVGVFAAIYGLKLSDAAEFRAIALDPFR